jgi:hypothetical protein
MYKIWPAHDNNNYHSKMLSDNEIIMPKLV